MWRLCAGLVGPNRRTARDPAGDRGPALAPAERVRVAQRPASMPASSASATVAATSASGRPRASCRITYPSHRVCDNVADRRPPGAGELGPLAPHDTIHHAVIFAVGHLAWVGRVGPPRVQCAGSDEND